MAKIYFYYSAMNAGKGTTLLQSAHNYEERGMRVLVFTPKLDNRDGVGMVSSRIGLTRQATVFSNEDDLYDQVQSAQSSDKIHCILIDEAQFLTPLQVLQISRVTDRLDIPVLCYGIRTDFQGEPFEGSKYLLAWADELIEIKTICRSGKKATMNARLDSEGNRVWAGDQIDIGTHYVALSRKEFCLDRISPISDVGNEE